MAAVKVLLGNKRPSWADPKEVLPYTPPKRFPDEFALTRLSYERWTVTHIPTGLKIGDGYWKTPDAAAKYASKVLRNKGVAKFRAAKERALRRLPQEAK